MKTTLKFIALAASVATLAACEGGIGGMSGATDKTVDRGLDSKSLTELKAGIWIDPNGCHHWIIDDGIEGYMDARRTPDGRSVCDDTSPRNTVQGTFKTGGTSIMGDPI